MLRKLCLLIAVAAPAAAAAQGKLDAVRDAVDKSRTENRSSDDSTPDENPVPDLFGGISWDPLASKVRFAEYPYASPDAACLLPKSPGAEWGGRASVETGSDFSGLNRAGLRLFLDSDVRLGLKTDWDYYTERLACGCRDSLWLGDLTATYRLVEDVQTAEMQIHVGAGARWLLDHGDSRAGLNFYTGFEFFPKQPVHLFGSLEAGTLGSAGVYRARAGAGWHWSRGELYGGYDYFYIGGVRLQGPFVGVRLWF
ncbi:MAG TPA: hypothetical protein VKD90_13395 [Gemmataceae bacterium]|nr:hypothetical protein [Gemmataceae bacterium]